MRRHLTDVEIDDLQRRARVFFRNALGDRDGEEIWRNGQSVINTEQRVLYYAHVIEDVASIVRGEKSDALTRLQKYKWEPVGIREFIESPEYLARNPGEVWEPVMVELERANTGAYVEAICTGGIGSGKTTFALYTNAYQLYLMSCLRDPHKVYGQDQSAELLFIFQSITAQLARTVDFARFRTMLLSSPYFMRRFAFDKGLESRMVFPNRIQVVPVSGKDTAAIGQNVIGGLIDELNYMAVVEKSKKSLDAETYDQAVAVYNSIARRRKSRFMRQGKLPGMLCLVSSRKYPGQFTDQKEEEARDPGSAIFVYDKRVWDVKPDDFGSERFHFFVGDGGRRPRVVAADEDVGSGRVIEVPVEFRADFDKDPYNALREIAGVATIARHPYIPNTEAVARAFGRVPSVFDREVTDFCEPEGERLRIIREHCFNPKLPRAVHVDLGATSDSAGLAMACVPEFVDMQKQTDLNGEAYAESVNQWMPLLRYDGVLEIKPPPGGEILFYKIRNLIVALRDQFGFNIQWVTFDTFESRDSQQLLRQKGFRTGVLSVDRVQTQKGVKTTDVYGFAKAALYSSRVLAPRHARANHEFLTLERDAKTGKIDHPPKGSKDCADAMTGVCYTLTTRRMLWLEAGIEYEVPDTGVPEIKMKTAAADAMTEPEAAIEREPGETLHDYRERVRRITEETA